MPGSYIDIDYHCKNCGLKLHFNNRTNFCNDDCKIKWKRNMSRKIEV